MTNKSQIPDITGKKFQALTAIKFSHKHTKWLSSFWLFQCECGKQKILQKSKVICGHIVSCGCGAKNKKRTGNPTHNLSKTQMYILWKGMRQRCNNPKNPKYPNYGGRGIKICDRWDDFRNYLNDMGERPSPKHSIDRIDNNGDYTPENCRWATNTQQTRNQRSNIKITLNGDSKCLSEWAEINNLSESCVRARIIRGWNPSDAITKPLNIKFKRC
jgi:hypothetical protein